MKEWVTKATPPRGHRRARRLRRPLRRLRAQALRAPAARLLHRRRRHQGRDRAGDGRPRHHRPRPGRHGRRRPRGVRRRAAVHDRLHRVRQGRPRAGRRDRQGHRRGLRRSPAAPWSAARPPSTPGLLGPDEYDVAGAATGVVEADRLLGPERIRPGDVVVAMASSGLHSNGYSLVRHVLLEPRRGLAAGPRRRRARPHPRRGAPGADPDLRQACLALPRSTEMHAMSHITGGGLAANLARVMPGGLTRDHRPRPPGRRRRCSTSSRGPGRSQADLEAP